MMLESIFLNSLAKSWRDVAGSAVARKMIARNVSSAPAIPAAGLKKICVARVKNNSMESKALTDKMDDAELKAWDALSKYKFWMFGYWAAIWVHYNRINNDLFKVKARNPFIDAVKLARTKVTDNVLYWECSSCGEHFIAMGRPKPTVCNCSNKKFNAYVSA